MNTSWSGFLSTYSGGLRVTIELFASSTALAFALGIPLGLIAARVGGITAKCIQGVGVLASAAPPLVVLIWVHYPGQHLVGLLAPPFLSALVAISALGTCYVSQAVLSVEQDFPRGLEEAALLCGLNRSRITWRVKAPLLARRFAPQAVFIALTLFQITLLASFIGVEELFRVALRLNSVEYRPVPIFTTVAAICLAFAVPLQVIGMMLATRTSADLTGKRE